jgi:hypothetical protein
MACTLKDDDDDDDDDDVGILTSSVFPKSEAIENNVLGFIM